mmetsp:Transcript_302/g.817  ORF Transcript_302/g.817 Transcript_302/m.817 type:complete len:310 (-) Transcript_302:382-1311(-)
MMMGSLRGGVVAAAAAAAVVVPGSADMRADLEVIKFFPKSGEGSFTLQYSDFSANLMANGAHNNVCAWDVCRGNRQGLTFSNGEPLWTAGEGTRIASFQIMTPVHKIRFSKFCARSFDYDPDEPTWWISKGFGIADGRVKDNDIGYIQIEGLADFCAVDENKFKAGAKVGRTPSPIKLRKLLQDDIMDELRRVHANMHTMPKDRMLVELATIKKRASRSERMAQEILPLMREIHEGLTKGGTYAATADGVRTGKLKVSAKRKSARIMTVVVSGVFILLGVVVLSVSGSDSKKPSKTSSSKSPTETKKDK